MKEKNPFVSIITVNFNGAEFLEECLTSIYNLKYPQELLEVILVDNGSTDNSLDLVREKFPPTKILLNKINNYCMANNLGIKTSKGEYILIVNNDVIIDENYLNKTIPYLIENEEVVIAISKILFPDGLIQSAGHCHFPNFYWGDRGFKEQDLGQYDTIEELESVSNTCSVYKRWIFEKIGGFDEDFNMYWEDVDFCYRCRKEGYKILYLPEAKCIHKFHGSAKEEFINQQIEKNRLLFIAKHFPEKLAENIFGQGFSTLEASKLNLEKFLSFFPVVILKLLKSHGQQVYEKVMPEVMKEIKKGLSYEKYKEVQILEKEVREKERIEKIIVQLEEELKAAGQEKQVLSEELRIGKEKLEEISKELKTGKQEINKLTYEKQVLSEELRDLAKEFESIRGEKGQLEEVLEKNREDIIRLAGEREVLEINLAQREEEIKKLCQENDLLENTISQLKARADELTFERNNLIQELEERKIRIENLSAELKDLKKQIQAFYSSETFRFLVKPFWKILDFLKFICGLDKVKIAIIKPYVVSVNELNNFIYNFRQREKDCKIIAIISADSSERDKYLSVWAERKLIFLRDKKFNCLFKFLIFISVALFNRFKEVYVLEGYYIKGGYRKARFLASLLSTPKIKIYYLYQNREEIQPNLAKLMIRFILARTSLYLIVLFFILVITPWTKLKKTFLRFGFSKK